ncbi:MAG: CopG family transcriptional regulator [Geodermatophilaceae bacterium]|jgi:hypothetical protein
MPYTERTQVLLSVDQRRRLERLARHEGKSVGAVIREAIERLASDSSPAASDDLETIFSLDLPVGDWSEMKAEIIRSATK